MLELSKIKNIVLNIPELLQENRILIIGNIGAGKTTIGKAIANELNGQIFEYDCGNITIEQIRDIVEKFKIPSLLKKKRIHIFDELQYLSERQASALLIPLQKNLSNDIVIGISSSSLEELKTINRSFPALISRLSYVIKVYPNVDTIKTILLDNNFSVKDAEERARQCNGDIRQAFFGTDLINELHDESIKIIARNPNKTIIPFLYKNRKIHPDLCIEIIKLIDSVHNPHLIALGFTILKDKHKVK